jgi:hypothetical protein
MVEVNARILPTPQVQYRTSKVQPNNGQWRMRGQRVSPNSNKPH